MGGRPDSVDRSQPQSSQADSGVLLGNSKVRMTEKTPREKRIHPEMMVAVSAVFIGVCALVVSLYEAQLMREEQRLSVLPILELGRSHYTIGEASEKWRLSLHAENVGIGPAVVKDFHVRVDGKPHKTWRSAIAALLDGRADISYGQSTINGRTIPPDRTVTMFDLSNTEIAADIVAEFERFNFEACFCSVFGDCWTTDYSSGFSNAEPVAECEVDGASFTE